jgi:uncharacterized protein YciW
MLAKINNVLKSSLNLLEGFAGLLGLIFTFLGLKEVWSEEGRKKYNLLQRLALSSFYLFHISAIILAALLAAGVISEFIMSATVATVIVSTTSLFNDLFEYLQEKYQNFNRLRKLNTLQKRLREVNIDFQQNALFFEDILEREDEIALLIAQRQEIHGNLSQINAENEDQPRPNINELKNITRVLKEKYDAVVDESEIIYKFYQGLTRRQRNEIDIVENTDREIKEISLQKEKLQKERMDLFYFSGDNLEKVTFLDKKINELDKNIKQLAIVNQYFFRLLKAKKTLKELKEQLDNLNKKYQEEPFTDYSPEEIFQLVNIERDYLNARILSLKNIIQKATYPEPSNNFYQTQLGANYYFDLLNLSITPTKAILVRVLTQQIKDIDNLISTLEKNLKEKQKYIQIVVTNPNQELPEDLSKIFNHAKTIIETKNEIELAALEENQKLWSAGFSIVTAISAFILFFSSFWIASSILNNLMQFLGVSAGVSTVWGFFQKQQAKNRLQTVEEREISQLIRDCKNRAEKVKDPNARSAINRKLGSIIEKLNQPQHQYPTRANENARNIHHQFKSAQAASNSPRYMDPPKIKSSTRLR